MKMFDEEILIEMAKGDGWYRYSRTIWRKDELGSFKELSYKHLIRNYRLLAYSRLRKFAYKPMVQLGKVGEKPAGNVLLLCNEDSDLWYWGYYKDGRYYRVPSGEECVNVKYWVGVHERTV